MIYCVCRWRFISSKGGKMSEPLTHNELFELIADVESALRNLRNSDGIYALEARNMILERHNRELRGRLAQLETGRTGSYST